jgi:hypothetical protein
MTPMIMRLAHSVKPIKRPSGIIGIEPLPGGERPKHGEPILAIAALPVTSCSRPDLNTGATPPISVCQLH